MAIKQRESALNILKYNVSQNGTSEVGRRQRGLDSLESYSFLYEEVLYEGLAKKKNQMMGTGFTLQRR